MQTSSIYYRRANSISTKLPTSFFFLKEAGNLTKYKFIFEHFYYKL